MPLLDGLDNLARYRYVTGDMASIHKRPDSPYWRAFWRTTDGTLIARSTKLTDRTKALTFALECERAEKMAGAGALTEAQAREIVSDIMRRAGTGETLRCPSVREHLRDWLASKEATKAEGTTTRYAKSVNEFLDYLRDRADKPLTSLTARQIEGFVTARSAIGLSPSTVALDGKVIRTALNKARRQGLLTTNPAEAVDLPENDSVERGAFTPAEVKMLVDAADGEWKTLITLAYFTGARLSDCCRMEWESVDLAKGVLTYTQGKTGKKVAVPLHPDLREHLETLASVDTAPKFIMRGMADKGPGGRHGLSESFKNIMRKAGVDPQPVEREIGVRTLSRRSFHALRHSFTSALANAGVAPELRMKLTGHKTESIHQAYTHHELETLRGAIGKLPRLAKA
jgi:integrase